MIISAFAGLKSPKSCYAGKVLISVLVKILFCLQPRCSLQHLHDLQHLYCGCGCRYCGCQSQQSVYNPRHQCFLQETEEPNGWRGVVCIRTFTTHIREFVRRVHRSINTSEDVLRTANEGTYGCGVH